jgi:hypothetical protein
MTHACLADEALAELLLAAERLAEAVDDYHAIADDHPPYREQFDDGEEGEREFSEELERYEEDQAAAVITLGRALRNYRHAQEREVCARAVVGINGGQRSAGSPPSNHPSRPR